MSVYPGGRARNARDRPYILSNARKSQDCRRPSARGTPKGF